MNRREKLGTPIVVVGAGGFGRETLDVLEALNLSSISPSYVIRGVVDDNPSPEDMRLILGRGMKYLGTVDDVLRNEKNEFRYLIGIGSPGIRQKIDRRFREKGFLPGSAIHPTAVIGSDFHAAAGAVVCAGVQISTNVKLGAHVHINPGAIIGHDAAFGDFVSVNPGAIVSGRVEVQPRALLGAGSIVLQGLCIGEDSLVGAGAVVVKDVPTQVTVKGVPAR